MKSASPSSVDVSRGIIHTANPCTVVEAVADHHASSLVSHPKLDAVAAVNIANALVREMDDSSVAVHEVPGALGRECLDALGINGQLSDWRESVQELISPAD